MNIDNHKWMKYSIDISTESSQSGLHVGAALVSKENKLLCSAFSGEDSNESWCSTLLKKIQKLQIFEAFSFFVTVNTLSETCSFDILELLKEVRVDEVYIGLPDPSLTRYLDDDPVFTLTNVYRYPDCLQFEILNSNKRYFSESKQSIKNSSYYSENRISNLVIDKLKAKGLAISKSELNANKRKADLATLICNKYKIEYSEANSIIHDVISEAFNSKYGTYSYSDDARSIDFEWKENFASFYKKLLIPPMNQINILNIGVGSGYEATMLFSNGASVTFVDVARDGLNKVKQRFPLSRIVVASADNLLSIPDNSYDLYISLRTYNSSFFDIREAIIEANRVLKSGATIVISVANGFLYSEQHCIIPGLIIPGTEFVDIYRGMDTIKIIQGEFEHLGFKNICFYPTNTEIYLSATIV